MMPSARTLLARRRRALQRDLEPVRRRLRGVLDAGQLGDFLQHGGVRVGAVVMVHVSMNELQRSAPQVDAMHLIALLKELLTPRGTLLVPTSPFVGLEADYVATSPVFDVRKTPSRMGLMTEVFRRMPDTTRSLHPTHSIAGWGERAEELLGHHHKGETFATTSPYCLMRNFDGHVVGIGAGVRNGFSLIHAAEYLHPGAREHAFSARRCTLTIIDGHRTIGYSFRPLKAGLDRRIPIIERKLRATGAVRYLRRAGLLVATAKANDFIDGATRLIADGVFYRSGTPAPQ